MPETLFGVLLTSMNCIMCSRRSVWCHSATQIGLTSPHVVVNVSSTLGSVRARRNFRHFTTPVSTFTQIFMANTPEGCGGNTHYNMYFTLVFYTRLHSPKCLVNVGPEPQRQRFPTLKPLPSPLLNCALAPYSSALQYSSSFNIIFLRIRHLALSASVFLKNTWSTFTSFVWAAVGLRIGTEGTSATFSMLQG